MDFSIHTMFQNKHITILFEDVKFIDNDGYQGIISVVGFDAANNLKEFSENDFIDLYPEAENLINDKLNTLIERNNNYPYKDGMIVTIL